MSASHCNLIHKTIARWTSNSLPNYPSAQCYRIIHRYINSDTLFNEINSSFKKLKQNKPPHSISIADHKKPNTKRNIKPSKTKKSKPKEKQIMHKSVPFTEKNKSISLKQREDDYLSRIKAMDDTLLPSKSVFDKYELIARDLEQQSNEYNNELINPKQKRKENIDQLIRKEIETKEKQNRQRFQDPILSELEYYEMPLNDLISTDNIVKHKPIKANAMIKYDSETENIIKSELNLTETDDDILTSPYDDILNDITETKHKENALMECIDWSKLSNYVELNGWNNFAEFLNETESKNSIQKYGVPGFLAIAPKCREIRDRPKAKLLGNEENAFKIYKINERVTIEAFKYERNGNIAVLVNNKHCGFIKKHNLPIDIKIGEYHIGYVYDINHFGKIEIIMEKPNFWSRMSECQRRIIAVLRYCNGTIEISDKSDAELIRKMFEMSKKNFKRAIGMLLKNGVVEIFNESDVDIPSKIVLNNNKIDLMRYDVAAEVEERMWKSKPIWEYGVSAPPFYDIIPDEMKERKKRKNEIYERKFTLRKKA